MNNKIDVNIMLLLLYENLKFQLGLHRNYINDAAYWSNRL